MSRKPAVAHISKADADRILALTKAELSRRIVLLPDALAPQLAMKSAAEIEWIWGEAVNALFAEVDAFMRKELDAATVFRVHSQKQRKVYSQREQLDERRRILRVSRQLIAHFKHQGYRVGHPEGWRPQTLQERKKKKAESNRRQRGLVEHDPPGWLGMFRAAYLYREPKMYSESPKRWPTMLIEARKWCKTNQRAVRREYARDYYKECRKNHGTGLN
jgi:hypothetical protein